MPEVDLSRFTTIVELSNLYPGSKAELPIIKGSTSQGDAPLPGVITTDRATGRIYEEKDGVLHPSELCLREQCGIAAPHTDRRGPSHGAVWASLRQNDGREGGRRREPQ